MFVVVDDQQERKHVLFFSRIKSTEKFEFCQFLMKWNLFIQVQSSVKSACSHRIYIVLID